MSDELTAVFNELYLHMEYGLVISDELLAQAESHGIRVEAVRATVQALEEVEDDFDNE